MRGGFLSAIMMHGALTTIVFTASRVAALLCCSASFGFSSTVIPCSASHSQAMASRPCHSVVPPENSEKLIRWRIATASASP